MTDLQAESLDWLNVRFGTEFRPQDYYPHPELPEGTLVGWIGGRRYRGHTLYVQVYPDGTMAA